MSVNEVISQSNANERHKHTPVKLRVAYCLKAQVINELGRTMTPFLLNWINYISRLLPDLVSMRSISSFDR